MEPDWLSVMLKLPGPKLPSTVPLQLPTSDGSTAPSDGAGGLGALGVVDERLSPQASIIVAKATTMMHIEWFFRLIAVSIACGEPQVGRIPRRPPT